MKPEASQVRLFNTLTKRKEPLEPMQPGRLNVFVCGPTVYDYPHIGHAKTTTQFDFIIRFLRFAGLEVTYLQNITDIDDKIIARAQERGISWEELAREFESIYLEDMEALGNTAVTRYPRATEHIDQIVEQVKALLGKGFAYKTSDGIYYEVEKFADYGRLSGRTELQSQDSVSRVDDSLDKRSSRDFCLWKFRRSGDPYWSTEIGEGRPGWHIEDTAITESYFGPQYDLHGGAIDLIFPHHEAEIAQMEAISGRKPLVRHWLHTGFLKVSGQKMSKSEGNFITVRQALEDHDYRVLRLFFLSAHYRSEINFSRESLRQSEGALRRLNEFVSGIDSSYDDREDVDVVESLETTVWEALSDDFDTPKAMAAIFEFVRAQNVKGKSGRRTLQFFSRFNEVFDVLQMADEDLPQRIQALVDERQQARLDRDYQKADEIRDRLEGMGIRLSDTKEGVRWSRVQ